MSLYRLVAITVLIMFYLNDCWLLSSKCYQMINSHTLVFKYHIIWALLLGVIKCIVQSSEGTFLNKGNRFGCRKDSCKYETNIDGIILSDQYQKSIKGMPAPGFSYISLNWSSWHRGFLKTLNWLKILLKPSTIWNSYWIIHTSII